MYVHGQEASYASWTKGGQKGYAEEPQRPSEHLPFEERKMCQGPWHVIEVSAGEASHAKAFQQGRLSCNDH